jgi:hypothetical protein
VARILRMMERYREQLRVFMNAFGGMVLAGFIFFFSHIIACLWYYIGTMDQEVWREGFSSCAAAALTGIYVCSRVFWSRN